MLTDKNTFHSRFKPGLLLNLVITLLIVLTYSTNACTQTLVNTTGSTIQNSNLSIEYSIGEIGITTLAENQQYITQGFLQPKYRIKDCNLLQLIPTAFTPNKDNLNDCFGVRNWPIVSTYELSVYNRWGLLVFKTSNITECWNGELHGQPQPFGTYVYNIKANTIACGQIASKGTLILIR
jgi:gliding motility-associated-like protein